MGKEKCRWFPFKQMHIRLNLFYLSLSLSLFKYTKDIRLFLPEQRMTIKRSPTFLIYPFCDNEDRATRDGL